MKSTLRVIAAALVLSMIIIGCKKKEEQPVPKAPAQSPTSMPMQDPMQKPMPPHGDMGPKIEKKIMVPESVKKAR